MINTLKYYVITSSIIYGIKTHGSESRLTVVSREAKAEAASARRRHSTHYT